MSSKFFVGAEVRPHNPPPTGLATRGAAVQLAAVQRLTNMSIEARKSGQTLRDHSQTNKTNKHKTNKGNREAAKTDDGLSIGKPGYREL
jgi:hypothetical protein